MGFDSVETGTYNSGVPATRPFVVAEQASAPVRLSSPRLRTPGYTALVLSMVGNRTYFDWCGSFAQAIRTRSARIDSGQYDRVCLRRIRRLGSRRSGTRGWQYVSSPVLEWKRATESD